MASNHRVGDFSRKLKPLEYEGNSQRVKIDCRIIQHGSTTSFEGKVPALDICVERSSLDEMYQQVCTLLDEKTSIAWSPYLVVELSGGGSKRFVKENHRGTGEAAFGIYFNLEVNEIEIGVRGVDKFTREDFGRISPGVPETGKDLRSYTHNGTDLETLDAFVENTPANREALILLGIEFEKLRKKLYDLFQQKTVQRTLTAAAARGLLTAAAESGKSKT